MNFLRRLYKLWLKIQVWYWEGRVERALAENQRLKKLMDSRSGTLKR